MENLRKKINFPSYEMTCLVARVTSLDCSNCPISFGLCNETMNHLSSVKHDIYAIQITISLPNEE